MKNHKCIPNWIRCLRTWCKHDWSHDQGVAPLHALGHIRGVPRSETRNATRGSRSSPITQGAAMVAWNTPGMELSPQLVHRPVAK